MSEVFYNFVEFDDICSEARFFLVIVQDMFTLSENV